MSSVFYLLRKSLKNLIKGAAKKPLVLIGYIFILVFIVFIIVASFMPSGMVRNGNPQLFKSIMILVFTVLYYTSLKLGIDKGSTFFRMSDVNLLFTAPIKPNHVLLYGFIKQIGGTFFMMFLAMCQIPNLRNNFKMEAHGVGVILLAVVAYTLAYPLLGMVIYSWSSKEKSRKKLLKRIFDIGAVVVALLFLLSVVQTRDFVSAMDRVFNHPVARYFPVIGWTGSIAAAAVGPLTTEFYVGAIGMLLLILGSAITLYRANLDFYEDVLEGVEFVEAAYKAKREGRNMTFNLKVKENVKQGLKGEGARAIFSKNLLELRKTSLFLFLDRMSLITIIASLVFRFVMPDEIGEMGLFVVLCFSVYLLMLFQIQGRLVNEMEKPYIFLIPASPFQKLFYVTLSEHLKNLADGCVLFISAGILFKGDVATVLACIFSYTSFGAVFVYNDVLNRRLFGWVHSKNMLVFIKIIASLLLLVPGIVAGVFVYAMTELQLLLILTMGGWSFILALTFFMFSAGILNNLESAG